MTPRRKILDIGKIFKGISPSMVADTKMASPTETPPIATNSNSFSPTEEVFSSLFQDGTTSKTVKQITPGHHEMLRPLKEFALRRAKQREVSVDKMNLLDGAETLKRRSIKIPTAPISAGHPERAFVNVASTFVQKLFTEMPLPTWLIDALAGNSIVQPTKVQQQVIESLLKGASEQTILVKGQTGTGKSLGYLIALLARLHKERAVKTTMGDVATCYHLVLVPNAILAQQLLRWVKMLVVGNAYLTQELSTIVRLLVSKEDLVDLDGSFPENICKRGFSHILIATPMVARSAFACAQLNVSTIKTIIVDEGDALLKPLSAYATAKEKLNRVRHPVPALTLLKDIMGACGEYGLQRPNLLVASASLNRRCKEDLGASGLLPETYLQISDDTKQTTCPPTIKHFYRMLADSQSIEELVQLVHWIWSERSGETGVLFVPATKSKTSMKDWLQAAGINAHILSELPTGDQEALAKITSDGSTLLLGSDIDARGWDLPMLKYVIVVDLPASPTHYLHMAGRVGRMGATGSVFSFVAGQQDLTRLINIYSMLKLSAVPMIQ